MKIGDIEFRDKPVFLAPMEDVTDASFRFICRNFGADMVYTEFVSSDGLIRDARKTLEKLTIFDYERPIGIQLYGHIKEAMVESAQIAETYNPELIDLNFGCPVKKIARRGAGAGMLCNIPLMLEITAAVVQSVKKPVTVKTRLGWDDSSKVIVDLAEKLQDTGITALTIHGRTGVQLYKGEADWTLIGQVKNNPRMKIPVIGNGDITSPEKAKTAFSKYGVDAIMIGRGIIGKPWLFRDIRYYLDHNEPAPEFTLKEKVELAKNQYAKSVEVKGNKVGILEMRRHFSNYFKGLDNFREMRLKLVTENDPDVIPGLLDEILDRWG
jgi:tRNA-dihydrouridine synthase B